VTTEAVTAGALADRMAALLAARPLTFYELLRELPDVEYRVVLQAWGALRERRALARDAHGRYLLREG
jgi:hypothetical protein